jgi:YidC/Oxa1 family membrane protein insertase
MTHPLEAVAIVQNLLNGIGWLLSKVYDLVANYALTIVLFTVGIRLILLPLNIKQVRSMQASQALQPKLKELQRKYKGDRVRQTEEINKLYKEHGVNPLGGCFPLLAQLPVLFALYAVLRVPSGVEHIPATSSLHTAIVQQTSGIKMLGANLLCSTRQAGTTVAIPASAHSDIKELDCQASGASRVTFYAMVLLMIATTYYQQRQMLKASPGGPTQQQQTLTYMMPLVFGFFGFTFPLGLVLYWTTTNFIQIGLQHFVRRSNKGELPPTKPAKEAPPKPKTPSGDGAPRIRRLEGRPPSQPRRKPSSGQSKNSSNKRTGNAGSRKKRPNR